MTSSTPNVVAVVVTYNGSRWVDQCFSSLTDSQHPVKVIVVDNNSMDDTVQKIRRGFPQVMIIENKHNAGFGGANNQAMKIAVRENADYVLLLNQDAWIEKDTVDALIKAFQSASASGYGIISPLHYNGKGDKLDAAFYSYVSKSADIQSLLQSSRPDVHQSDFINAAAWMVSRKCMERVGGFGYLFHQYGEDRDYIQRLVFMKMKLGFITTTKIFHDRPEQRFDFNTSEKITWYYTTGVRVRLADINRPYLLAWVSVLFWLMKEITALVFSRKVFALKSFATIVTKTFFGSFLEISSYRKKIKAATPFLF